MRIELGKEVRCKITGLKGIAVSRCEFLYGCVRVGIQQKGLVEGKQAEIVYVDEPQLEVAGKGIAVAEAYRHGPRANPTRVADPTKR